MTISNEIDTNLEEKNAEKRNKEAGEHRNKRTLFTYDHKNSTFRVLLLSTSM